MWVRARHARQASMSEWLAAAASSMMSGPEALTSTVEDIQDKRVNVLRLHIEELTRQSGAHKAELRMTRTKLKELEMEQQAARPQERKLFAKLDKLTVCDISNQTTRPRHPPAHGFSPALLSHTRRSAWHTVRRS